MGQQQLLLIILGVIIVGIAIAVGIGQFSSYAIQANRDGIISDIRNISATAYQYRIRPAEMGGGSNSYIGFLIPASMDSSENGHYTINSVTANTISISGSSSKYNAVVAGVFGSDGKLTGAYTFTGDFNP